MLTVGQEEKEIRKTNLPGSPIVLSLRKKQVKC